MNQEFSPKEIQKTAIILAGGEVLSCRLCADGSLSVVKGTGEKVLFPRSEVLKACEDATWIHAEDKSPQPAEIAPTPPPAQKRSHHRKPA